MALVSFTSTKSHIPTDAIGVQELPNYAGANGTIWIWHTHAGLCIKEREANFYDDSDFYMTVWNDEKDAPEEIMFATTRGWSYPCLGSFVDATPEVLEKYAAWQEKKLAEWKKADRRAKATAHKVNKRLLKEASERFDVPYSQLVKLRRLEGYLKMLALFNPRKRNKFSISMREQVLKWVRDHNPQYAHPLSKKQRQYLR